MSKKGQRKKKLEQSDPILQPPTVVSEAKKIRPRSCLLLQTYTASSRTDYLDFRVKRGYYRQLDLSAESYKSKDKPDETALQLFQAFCKMKYLYRLQIKDFDSKRWNLFYQTKVSRIREIAILLHYQSFSQVDEKRIANLAKEFKRLKRLNLESLKIRILQTSIVYSQTLSQLFTNITPALKDLMNLKEFNIVINRPLNNEQFWPSILKEIVVADNSSKFKKLQKLETLNLAFQDFQEIYLKNLKSIKLAATDENHGKEIIENLCKIKSLTSFTIYKFAEPNDILSLALELPNLRSINIKDDWIFSSQDMPALKIIKEKGLDIIQLHIDVPLDIESDEDVNFMVTFLKPFKEIRSLHLHIRSGEGDKDILHPIAKSINSLHKLEKLRIGLLARSSKISSQFLPYINSLKELKEVVLVLKRDCQSTWDTEIKETYQGVKSFLVQSKKLKNVIIDWDHFTPKCAEHLKLIVDEMEDLDMFRLGYLTTAQCHGKVHDYVLRLLEHLFRNTTTKIKRVTLATLCLEPPSKVKARELRERYMGYKINNPTENECSVFALDLSKTVENNKNIIKFVFEAGRSGHPFFYKSFK